MAWIELAEEDRKKYGTPERIEFEYGQWGLKSIDALETEVGWTLEDLGNALQRKKHDEHGNVVMEDKVDSDGNSVLDEDGKPVQVEMTAPSKTALAAVVWLVLRGIGIRVPWDDFDPRAIGLRVDWSDGTGKAEDPEGLPD
jgi:hypothetical protein